MDIPNWIWFPVSFIALCGGFFYHAVFVIPRNEREESAREEVKKQLKECEEEQEREWERIYRRTYADYAQRLVRESFNAQENKRRHRKLESTRKSLRSKRRNISTPPARTKITTP